MDEYAYSLVFVGAAAVLIVGSARCCNMTRNLSMLACVLRMKMQPAIAWLCPAPNGVRRKMRGSRHASVGT